MFGLDGADDLAAVDALEVDARDAEVGVSELALDDDEWDAVARDPSVYAKAKSTTGLTA